jgi:peptidyl-prolyl cis-trans isomerase SurA
MKYISLLVFLLLSVAVSAQTDDPVIMTINSTPITRSEFEYSYNKNNSEAVVDMKTVDEYVDMFVNYKLKVFAALDAHLDTLKSFRDEFKSYRDQQIRPALVTDADIEREAHSVYDKTKERIGSDGLLNVRNIFIHVAQKAPKEQISAAKARIDSLYGLLQHGADFKEIASKYSEDKGSAMNGGMLQPLSRGTALKEFEDAVFALKVGETSKPFQSPVGFHIAKLESRQQFAPYDSLRKNIIQFITMRGVREKIANDKLDSLSKVSGGKTKEQILDEKATAMQASNADLRNLIKEYHDGLLLYEISNRTVWDKASKDEAGLNKYFKKNKKKYRWTEPRFKGIVFHVKDAATADAVKKCIQHVAYDKWNDTLRNTFNKDTVIRVRADKGVFKAGDNPFVDKLEFHKDVKVQPVKDYPVDGTFGELIKKGPKNMDDVRGLVVSDYQQELEKDWISSLRAKYPVTVDKAVLATVNKHK